MKYAILFIPSGIYLYSTHGKEFPESAIYSEYEKGSLNPDLQPLVFHSKRAALRIFNKSIWEKYFPSGADYIIFNNQKYYIIQDKECFEIIKIKEK